ncbi:hypothetical protein PQZ60_gp67 [Klebsiella phage vB_KpnM_FZ14]|nr:hypothetical protein PQZ60_gp67 [Klebsiella phage vB_KpnM_FZ14]
MYSFEQLNQFIFAYFFRHSVVSRIK